MNTLAQHRSRVDDIYVKCKKRDRIVRHAVAIGGAQAIMINLTAVLASFFEAQPDWLPLLALVGSVISCLALGVALAIQTATAYQEKLEWCVRLMSNYRYLTHDIDMMRTTPYRKRGPWRTYMQTVYHWMTELSSLLEDNLGVSAEPDA